MVSSDEDALAAVVQGSEAALRLLYERHAAAMLRLVRRLTSRSGLAEEIVQEAWIAVWQSAGSYRGQASVRAWLMGVTRRQAHNVLRKPEVQMVDLEAVAELVDGSVEVEATVLAQAGHEDLLVAVRALPAHLRETVTLAWVDELGYGDIAAVLGIPVGTVKSRVSHARARLAVSLSQAQVKR